MKGASLRHQPPQAPSRQPVPRGASRMVAKEPMSARLPKANFGFLKALYWPVLLVVLGFGTYEGAQRLLPYADRPITKISVQGDLSYISQQAVQQRIGPYLVTIRLEEQLPVARWGDEALLNNQGQAFTPRELANYEHLPQLFGPQRAQQQVMQQYQALSQMLRPMGFSIARLELRERGSWFLTTGAGSSGPGIQLLLGRDRLVEKMRRFIAIYDKTLKEQITNIASVDLRYANGLAVGWREPAAPTAAQPAVAKN